MNHQTSNHKPVRTQGACIWFTGLSGSGKTSLAKALAHELASRGVHAYLLDGDALRTGLNKDLDFSPSGRTENIRRAGEVAKLFVDAGIILLAAFISPYQRDRDAVRSMMPESQFIEVFVKTDLTVCEARDPKGLYKKARANEILDFTGISAPYEEPLHPEISLENNDTAQFNTNVQNIITFLQTNKII